MSRRPFYDLEVSTTGLLGPPEVREQPPANEGRVHITRIRSQTRVDPFQGRHTLQITRPRVHLISITIDSRDRYQLAHLPMHTKASAATNSGASRSRPKRTSQAFWRLTRTATASASSEMA